MIIGIDASRAFLSQRTGIEEYSYQVIRHLRDVISEDDRVVLYIRPDQNVDFRVPEHWEMKRLWAPLLWTQARLSLEMLFHRPDVLFVPAHTVPLLHPRKTFVTVHGLEYEFCPGAYSFWGRLYMRFSIRYSVRAASQVVVVSENTKRDLMRLYGVPEEKIAVVYEGISIRRINPDLRIQDKHSVRKFKFQTAGKPYLLFVGRLEERKNIERIIEAFEILKERHCIYHKLVLAGKSGYGYGNIENRKMKSPRKEDIVELGYVSQDGKAELLRDADVLVFPTLYEGFGLPVLEAQAVGTPVVASIGSSLPEVGGDGALYVNPIIVEDIADTIWKLLSDKALQDDIVRKGFENVKRFGWEKCSKELSVLLHS